MKREPILDYYGTEVEVACVYKSAGKFIYLDAGDEMVRLTPQQALDLVDWLKEAVTE